MSQYTVIICGLVLGILCNAVQHISARCRGFPVASVTLEGSETVESTNANGLVYGVHDLAACERCKSHVTTITSLADVSSNPVIAKYKVSYKNNAGDRFYNLQPCKGNNDIIFWVKTEVQNSDYTAFYVD